ncbi:hypothetical protein [Actinoplanes solisilvae]|uniref:hypothetical protein n=1 Tax=Actinoplanes solisilvae TaxID=2486853 RepID=UPI000FDB0379|nr:hypothetical protein [Actinoplanes solisilvae]
MDAAASLPIATPSPEQVRLYLARWHGSDNERIDVALRKTFDALPSNRDVGEVGVKIAALNGLYWTNILGVLQVARHIVAIDIDARLDQPTADPELIEKIATVKHGGKRRRHYSFATKYSSFHQPAVYPIYDSLVAGVLNALLKQGETFDIFTPQEHWRTDYAVWCRSVRKFRTHYGLDDFSLRDIDKYLWTMAKEREAMRPGRTRNLEDPTTAI